MFASRQHSNFGILRTSNNFFLFSLHLLDVMTYNISINKMVFLFFVQDIDAVCQSKCMKNCLKFCVNWFAFFGRAWMNEDAFACLPFSCLIAICDANNFHLSIDWSMKHKKKKHFFLANHLVLIKIVDIHLPNVRPETLR